MQVRVLSAAPLKEQTMERVYLSRRNLLTLLSKLDRQKNGEQSFCTIIKHDNVHKKYPQTLDNIMITAVEDEDYYESRKPGAVYDPDTP